MTSAFAVTTARPDVVEVRAVQWKNAGLSGESLFRSSSERFPIGSSASDGATGCLSSTRSAGGGGGGGGLRGRIGRRLSGRWRLGLRRWLALRAPADDQPTLSRLRQLESILLMRMCTSHGTNPKQEGLVGRPGSRLVVALACDLSRPFPSRPIVKICLLPVRVEVNARCRPVGENAGLSFDPWPSVICVTCRVATL